MIETIGGLLLSAVIRAPGDTREIPCGEYCMEKRVAVSQTAYELEPIRPGVLAHWSTAELFDQLAEHNIKAVRLHYRGNPFDGMGPWEWSPTSYAVDPPLVMTDLGAEDMYQVWTHPDIDTIVIRFTSPAWATYESGCIGPQGTIFSDAPYYEIAFNLLKWFGDQDKHIILADWEADWQIRGWGCDHYLEDGSHVYPFDDSQPWYSTTCIDKCLENLENNPNSSTDCRLWGDCSADAHVCTNDCGDLLWADRAEWVREQTKRRQRAVREAREAFPNALLRVEYGAIGNFYPSRSSRSGPTMFEMIGEMDEKPDRVGLSFWHLSRVDDEPAVLIQTLDWVEEVTGLPRHRIFIDEFGSNDPDVQFDRIYNLGRAAFEWGVPLASVWLWKQSWCSDTHFGIWNQCQPCEGKVTWCTARGGMQAVKRLLRYLDPSLRPGRRPPPQERRRPR